MIKNTTNTTFSSKIYFVPQNELRQLAHTCYGGHRSFVTVMAPDVKKIHEGGLCSVKNLQNNEKGFTEGIIYCIGGLLKEGNNRLMFHFFPPNALTDMPKIEEAIKNIDKNGKLKGLFIGGAYSPEENKHSTSKESLALLGNLKKIFKNIPNKDFTIFYGQKKSHKNETKNTSFLYDSAQDNYLINIDVPKITPKNIKNYFKFTRISPNDEVFIGGKKISSKLIET